MSMADIDAFDYYYDHPPQLPAYGTPFDVHAGWWSATAFMQDEWKPENADASADWSGALR